MLKSMLHNLRDSRAIELEGEGAGEAGFTLIELMVVLLIMAILLAIAIPTFLGVTGGANDRAAQSNLTNALTEAEAVYQDNGQAYTPAVALPTAFPVSGATDLYNTSAPEFQWAAAASTSQNEISIDPFDVATSDTTGQGVALAVLSKTGTCWYIINLQQTPGTGNASKQTTAGTFYGEKTSATSCNASSALATDITGTSYSTATTGIGS
jgi:type IV pilus assembly protein PilA